jgi:hypothetical protein
VDLGPDRRGPPWLAGAGRWRRGRSGPAAGRRGGPPGTRPGWLAALGPAAAGWSQPKRWPARLEEADLLATAWPGARPTRGHRWLCAQGSSGLEENVHARCWEGALTGRKTAERAGAGGWLQDVATRLGGWQPGFARATLCEGRRRQVELGPGTLRAGWLDRCCARAGRKRGWLRY